MEFIAFALHTNTCHYKLRCDNRIFVGMTILLNKLKWREIMSKNTLTLIFLIFDIVKANLSNFITSIKRFFGICL